MICDVIPYKFLVSDVDNIMIYHWFYKGMFVLIFHIRFLSYKHVIILSEYLIKKEFLLTPVT